MYKIKFKIVHYAMTNNANIILNKTTESVSVNLSRQQIWRRNSLSSSHNECKDSIGPSCSCTQKFTFAFNADSTAIHASGVKCFRTQPRQLLSLGTLSESGPGFTPRPALRLLTTYEMLTNHDGMTENKACTVSLYFQNL